jgi:hypothetical protein
MLLLSSIHFWGATGGPVFHWLIVDIAIENGHRKFADLVDLAMNSMVIFQFVT